MGIRMVYAEYLDCGRLSEKTPLAGSLGGKKSEILQGRGNHVKLKSSDLYIVIWVSEKLQKLYTKVGDQGAVCEGKS